MATAQETKESMDDFGAAFEQLAALGDKPIPLEGLTIPVAAAATKPVEKVATEQEAAPAATVPEETGLEDLTPEEKAAAEAAETETETETEASVTDREADLLAKFAKAVRGDEKTAPTPTAQEAATEPVAPTPLFTSDEVTFLTKFQEDWPDVMRAAQVMLRVQARQVTDHVFAEIAKSVGPRFAMLESMADDRHETALHTTIPDYDDVRDKVIEWAGKQPAYLQPAYNRVISDGTVDEIADLVNRYRKDSGVGAPTAKVATPAKTESELSPAAKKAAAALAPVNSKRTAVVQQASPEDFDAAFVAFANAV